MDVHHPYRPPAEHHAPFDRGPYSGSAVVRGHLKKPDGKRVFSNLPWFQASQRVATADIEQLLSLHEGAIHYTDALLPELLAALDFDPARDLLVISADHGEQFFEHGYLAHGRTLMPGEIHIPLLVRWDGFTARRVATPVGLVDWFPTFADLYGERAPDGLSGRSLLPALRGDSLPERPVYSEGHVHVAGGAAVVSDGHLYWLCSDNGKLTPWVESPYSEALCDLRSDPLCERELGRTQPERMAELNAVLREVNPVWQSFDSRRCATRTRACAAARSGSPIHRATPSRSSRARPSGCRPRCQSPRPSTC